MYTEKLLVDFATKNNESHKIKNVAFVIKEVDRDYLGYGNKYGYGYSAKEKTFWDRFR